MSALNNPVILENDTTLTDESLTLNAADDSSDTVVIPNVAAEDAIYIGSRIPFNTRYIDVSVANDQVSSLSASVWDGSTFKAVARLLDGTASSAGATLAQSGLMMLVPDKEQSWVREDTEDMTGSGLEALKIYNLYWMRLNYSSNLNALTALRSIKYRFSDDVLLAQMYPNLASSSTLSSFESGKTNWNDQHYLAADTVIRWLQTEKWLDSFNQILNYDLFAEAAVHNVAYRIFTAFGDSWEDARDRANKDFNIAMRWGVKQIDQNRNARLDEFENVQTVNLVRR